jgi:hypothetical protein
MVTKRLLTAGIVVCFAAAIIIALLAPPEAQLGDAAKLIYFHAALVFVSMILVSAVGILGLLHLVTGRRLFFDWSRPAKAVMLFFWTFYLTSSVFAMKWAWGGILWTEPRFLLASSILVTLIAIALLETVFETPRVVSALNVLMGVIVWVLVSRVPAVMHPTTNPISNSGSAPIKYDTLGIFLFLAAAAALSVVLGRLLTQKETD